jgi:hypothetical protein
LTVAAISARASWATTSGFRQDNGRADFVVFPFGLHTVDGNRLRRARRAFGAPRFRAIRKAWLQDGDRVVDVAMSTSLADAIARESGRFERHELSRQYFHLSSMVGSA